MIPIIHTTFKGMEHSEAVENLVLKEAEKLERYYPRITSCRVTVEKPHRHQVIGAPFSVHIAIAVPGDEIVISHAAGPEVAAHKDVQLAVQDAFRRAARRVQDYAQEQAEVR